MQKRIHLELLTVRGLRRCLLQVSSPLTNSYPELPYHEETGMFARRQIIHGNHACIPAFRIVRVNVFPSELAQITVELVLHICK